MTLKTLLRSCRQFLQSAPARLWGSYIGPGEGFTGLSTGAEFPIDLELVTRQLDARDRLGPLPVESRKTPMPKPRLILENPDYPPVDFDRLPQ